MITIDTGYHEPIVFFDVDGTLVIWDKEDDARAVEIGGYKLVPHVVHIAKLILHKENGCKIVVWSAAGGDWAKIVVEALKLEEWVDVCMGKPSVWYDDLDSTEVLSWYNKRFERYE